MEKVLKTIKLIKKFVLKLNSLSNINRLIIQHQHYLLCIIRFYYYLIIFAELNDLLLFTYHQLK